MILLENALHDMELTKLVLDLIFNPEKIGLLLALFNNFFRFIPNDINFLRLSFQLSIRVQFNRGI